MKSKLVIMVLSVYIIFLSLWNLFVETPDYSESERRVLANFPEVSIENILNGTFFEEFEEYAVERFVARDTWRQVKAYAKTLLFLQKDNNGIYTARNHISKMDNPENEEMVDYAAGLFEKIRETYLKDNDIYLAVIPDKNWYLAKETGHLALDYEQFSAYVAEQMEYAEYIEISDLLEADDYYDTDTHWRQECLEDVAERICKEMGVNARADYQVQQLETPFYGVYVGQSALKAEPDTIYYLQNETIQQAVVEGVNAVYDMEKAAGRDPYEIFLSGNQPVVTMKNPQNDAGKRLIIFRDSFASSLAPLLLEGYSEVVLVDLRYLPSQMLADYVDFEGADVLFLYSTSMLNNSRSMK